MPKDSCESRTSNPSITNLTLYQLGTGLRLIHVKKDMRACVRVCVWVAGWVRAYMRAWVCVNMLCFAFDPFNE